MLRLVTFVGLACAVFAVPREVLVQELTAQAEQLAAEQETRNAEIGRLKEQISALSIVENPISFTVYRIGDYAINSGEFIPYNTIITNVGSHYNPTLRAFISPVDGLFVFHFTTGSTGASQTCRIELFHNEVRVVTGFSPSGAVGSNNAVLQIKAGDIMSVRPENGLRDCVIHGDSRRYTTFSGFQIA